MAHPVPPTPRRPSPHTAPPAAAAPITHVNLDRCRLSLIKGEHRWRFRWERGSEAALICAVADLARNPSMSFDWFDAAAVCRHIVGGGAASIAHGSPADAAQISPAAEM
jgi:hypothetical protein